MTTVFAPARLPLSTVDEGPDYDDEHNDKSGDISLRHDYLHSLVIGERWAANGGHWKRGGDINTKQTVLSVSIPETIAAPALSWRNRSYSESFISTRKMVALTAAAQAEENSLPDTAPSSPPELSYSKSSKSSNSSIHSDSSDGEDSTEKSSQFGDIAIEDEHRDSIEDSNLKPESRPTLKRPPPRSAKTTDGTRYVSSPPLGFYENRAPRPRPMPNGLLRDQSLNLPMGRGVQRGLISPSTPALTTEGLNRVLSRSPSPTKPFMHNGVCVSPSSLANATPKLSPFSPVSNNFTRRKSWQPGQRKTVQELEAECNDADEDVPDDAVLENVPISPMPGQLRISQSNSRSTTPSPQRQPSYTNLHSANVPKKAKRPKPPRVISNGQSGAPRSPKNGRPPMLQHSHTIAAFSPSQLQRQHRSKSWTEDLSEEAKKLSAALEEYADQLSTEKRSSDTTSVTTSPPQPSPKIQRSKTTILELPPVQKGNVMIDPLPISKEKEAVLTRTRPSWLPPKDQKEEKKHMKEWQEMMARAAENEKKRALKEREDSESQDEQKHSISRIWDQHVIPNWDVVVKEPRTRELWWRGVAPQSRGVVWQKAVGNELKLSDSSFDAALNRATELEETISEMTIEEHKKSTEAAWFDAISRDVPNTCPELTAAEKRAPFQNALRDVLKAYAMYRSDVGYVYGTHFIAGILCLHLRPSDAFVALANMLNRPMPLAFLVDDKGAMSHTYEIVLSTLKYKSTKLHDHLTSPTTGLKPDEYLDPIFRCLFAHNLPSDHVSRIWDIYVFEGDKTLIRAAVAVLGRLEGKLYGTRDEVLDILSWRNERSWDVGTEEEFIRAVREAGKVGSQGEAKNTI